MNQNKGSERKQCPVCAREVEEFWNFCVKCGTQLKSQTKVARYTPPERDGFDCRSKDRT